MWRWIIVGAIGTVVAIVLIGLVAVKLGLIPANADSQPSFLETWAARESLRATVQREASTQANPLQLNDQNLEHGIKLYGANCAICHGTSDAKTSAIAKGLYQKPPQLAKNGVEDDPEGQTYWKISHGIRLTGMPSFTKSLHEEEIWQLAMFLKHMDALPPKPQAAWKKLPSQGYQARKPLAQ